MIHYKLTKNVTAASGNKKNLKIFFWPPAIISSGNDLEQYGSQHCACGAYAQLCHHGSADAVVWYSVQAVMTIQDTVV
jgi:hypothetical protein